MGDEFAALQMFEKSGESMSRDEFRTKLKEVDVGNDGKMAFLEFLMYKYPKTADDILNALPGVRNDEWFDAKKEFDDIQGEFDAREEKKKKLIQATARFKKAEEVGPVKEKPAEAWWVER